MVRTKESKEQQRIYSIEYRKKNKEKIKAKKKEDYHKNRDRDKAKSRAYYKTGGGIRLRRLCDWRRRGVIFANREEELAFYQLFINTPNCQLCNVEFDDNYKKQQRCLDHCHISGLVRNIVCISCNSSLPRQVKSNIFIGPK